jgi:hypothetical protein
VTTFANGTRYPHGRYCVTDACVSATVDHFSGVTLHELTTGRVPVKLTAEQAVAMPFAFPLFVVLLVVLGAVGSFCCKSAPAYLAGSAASFNTCCFPFIGLLVGAAFVPVMLMTSDVCASLPGVATSYAARSPDAICGALGLDWVTTPGADPNCVVRLGRGGWGRARARGLLAGEHASTGVHCPRVRARAC